MRHNGTIYLLKLYLNSLHYEILQKHLISLIFSVFCFVKEKWIVLNKLTGGLCSIEKLKTDSKRMSLFIWFEPFKKGRSFQISLHMPLGLPKLIILITDKGNRWVLAHIYNQFWSVGCGLDCEKKFGPIWATFEAILLKFSWVKNQFKVFLKIM